MLDVERGHDSSFGYVAVPGRFDLAALAAAQYYCPVRLGTWIYVKYL
jgi:hypothetical protein